MTIRFQRLILILISLIFLASSLILILYNSKNNLIYFYTPSELITSEISFNSEVRIGGFVKKNSLSNNFEEKKFNFIITDNINEIEIEYIGILPDLFGEEQGAVIEGLLIEKNKLIASKVFAKHDENYMPSSIKKQLQKSDYWKKEY